MKCPKCKKEGARYTIQRNKKVHKKETKNEIKRRRKNRPLKKDKLPPREDFNAKCNKCGFSGKY